MRRIGTGLLVLLLFFWAGKAGADERAPSLTGEAVVLLDARNGQVLYEKNMHRQMYPASTTKILTAILALEKEKGSLDNLITVPEEACRVDGSAIGLQAGEKLTLRDLLSALMLASANDAAVTIACAIAGSVPDFANMMNEKAKSLGARESHFTNPHGLPAPDHYTSAYDLALITRYAMQNPDFRELVRTRLKVISRPEADRTKGPPQEHLWNHNRLLESYRYATGVKTGYTVEAGQCLVAAAQKGDRELIAVILNSQGREVYEDAQKILDYGFTNFEPVLVVEKGEKVAPVKVNYGEKETVDLITASDLWYDFPVDHPGDFTLSRQRKIAQKIQAPLLAGQKIGVLAVYNQGEKIGEVDLVAAESIARATGKSWLVWLAGAALGAFFLSIRSINRRKRKFSGRIKRYRWS